MASQSKHFSSLETDELEEKVKERKDLIHEIVTFMEETLPAKGTVVHKKEYDHRTHMDFEMPFAGFTLFLSSGLGSYGGDGEAKVFLGTDTIVIVLDVEYSVFSEREYVVKTFSPGSWYIELKADIRRKGEILQEMDKKAEEEKLRAEKKREKAEAEERKRKKLLEEAERLGL